MKLDELARLVELHRFDILDTPEDEYFDRLTRLAAHSCRTPIALISLVDQTRLWFKSVFGQAPREAAREFSLCSQVVQDQAALVCEDARQDLRFNKSTLVSEWPGIRFYAGVPLTTASGCVLGTLCVIDDKPRTITEEQLDTLKMLADQVIQQFELRSVSEALRRQTDLLERAQTIARIGGWELDLLSQVLSWSAETYRIHELSEAEYQPTVASALSFYSSASAVHIRQAVNDLIEIGRPYDLELQLITQKGGHRWVRATGQRDAGHARIYGVFQDITQRRNLEAEVLLIAQQEQTRIGIDLHDDLGQSLTGISLLLKEATGGVPEDLTARRKLQEIETMISDAIGTCRALAHGLAPVSEARGGLPHALKKLATMAGLQGIQTSVRITGFARLPEPVADHLYRIAREALFNAMRHARAHHIQLQVDLNPAQIVLSVTDDGEGIHDTQDLDGMGISVMRYRTRLIGAVLTLTANPGGGTNVSCLLNLAHLSDPPKDAIWALSRYT